MTMRDLIPWGRRRRTPSRLRPADDRTSLRDSGDPFLMLHREVNRLFGDILRGFDPMPFGSPSLAAGWPSVEVVETDRELRVCAELPGMDERDVEVLLDDGVLTIQGEKRAEREDDERRFSERFYGRFMRQLPVGEVDEDKVQASFKHGVLTVTLPKAPGAQDRARRIPIKGEPALTKH